ncbi:MAG: hypothetical protein HOW73_01060 [Polyangiaceae bacterium]|nr:hypothetical protein [Polyangiaceae bacterium]
MGASWARLPWVGLVGLVVAVVACHPGDASKTPQGGAVACSPDALDACESRFAEAVALGEGIGPMASAYAKARGENDSDDPFAQAVERAREAGKTSRGVLVVTPGAKDPGSAKDIPRVQSGALEPMGKTTQPELLALALAEAAGLDYVAVARADGSIVRAFGGDPLVIMMSGIAPVVVDREAKSLEGDLVIERALRAAVARAQVFDYVGAADQVDVIDKALDTKDPYDAQSIRGRLMMGAIGLTAPEPLLDDSKPAKPEVPAPAPRAYETPYYDLLRVRTDTAEVKAFDKRRERLLAGAPAEMRPFIERTWGTSTSCVVTLPPSFDRPRDLAYAYLLAPAILPAGARSSLGREPLAAWYGRYEKLVALIERTKTAYWGTMFLVVERGASSSILPTGQDAHRRVDAILLKHTRALEAVAKAKPGRIGIAQLGFLTTPGAHSDEKVREAMHSLTREAAQGALAQSTNAWEVLASAMTSLLVTGNMPPTLRQEHVTALASAFSDKLRGPLKTQTGWGVALAFAAELTYRALLGGAPDPKGSVAEITRALESDPTIVQPGLAALTSAMTRYAALAAEGGLGSPIVGEGDATVPTRAAARASLSTALSKLADGPAPDPRALAELASFADNATATLAFSIAESITKSMKEPAAGPSDKAACSPEKDEPTDPRLVRALAKLRDQRKKVLSIAALKDGKDAWSKRARLIALLLSDAIDVASAQLDPKKHAPAKKDDTAFPVPEPTAFFVSTPDSERFVGEALATFTSEAELVRATQNAYGLTRGFFEKGPSYFATEGIGKAGELLKSLAPLVADSTDPSSTSGLLLGFAASLGGAGRSNGPAFLDVARGLYDKGNEQEADMLLLAAAVATSLAEKPLTTQAFDVAAEKKSKMAWLLDFLRYARPSGSVAHEALPAPRFREGLDALVKDRCAVASTGPIVRALEAIEKFRGGNRDKARTDLDAALEEASHDLMLPHTTFTFTQQSTTRVLVVSIDIGLAAPFVPSTGGFNVGGGFKSAGESKLSIDVTVDSPDSKRARDDTARYYVNASATAAIYHFLSGDPQKGELAAGRALGTVLQRTWLFVPGVTDDPIRFADGAGATFAILAQQAIESGRPLLAGSLLQVVRNTFDPTTTRTEDITALLDNLPKPLQGIKDLEPIIARTKKTLALLGNGFSCVGPKSDKAFLLKPSCEAYPQAVALRVADAVAAMPELAAKKKNVGPGCKELAALDGFLVPAQGGKYEPDKLMEAVDRMLEEKKPYEAGFLLSRPRDPSHCTERVIQQMRTTAERLEGVPTMRADLLTAIVNCEVGAPVTSVTADLASLDRELDRVGDPSRQIQIGLFSAALSARRGEPGILETVVKKKGYLEQHRGHGPLLPIALTLDHLSSALSEKSIDVEGTQKDMDFLCGLSDQPAGPDTCKTLKKLRGAKDAAERKRIAEGVISTFGP